MISLLILWVIAFFFGAYILIYIVVPSLFVEEEKEDTFFDFEDDWREKGL